MTDSAVEAALKADELVNDMAVLERMGLLETGHCFIILASSN